MIWPQGLNIPDKLLARFCTNSASIMSSAVAVILISYLTAELTFSAVII